jgi:uncharacterized membrane protein YfcA
MNTKSRNLVIAGLALAVLVLAIGYGWTWLGLEHLLPARVLLLGLLWSALAGTTYAAAPEAGGLLVGFGHLTLFTGAVALALPAISPVALVDSIRLSNAVLGAAAGLAVLVRDRQRGGTPWSMPLWAAAGAASGAALASLATLGAVWPKMLHLFFAAYLAALTVFLARRYTLRGQERADRDQEAGEVLDAMGGPVEVLSSKVRKTVFAYGGVEFAFRPMALLALGLAVGLLTPLLGVGGFIFLPLLARLTRLPTRLAVSPAAATVAAACLVQTVVFASAGVAAPLALLGGEVAGLLAACAFGLACSAGLSGLTARRIFLAPAAYFGLRSLLLAVAGVRLWP